MLIDISKKTSLPSLGCVLSEIQHSIRKRINPIVVFDLDDTLFSTKERTLKIMREFEDKYAHKFPDFKYAMNRIRTRDICYEMRTTLIIMGVKNVKLYKELNEFWWKRFFQNEYLGCDVPISGAVEFVQKCYKEGALIYYCTGRHYRSGDFGVNDPTPKFSEANRFTAGMERGTINALLEQGFPLASGRAVLHLKEDFLQDDAEFKLMGAIPNIRGLNGHVVATFENEPENANQFLEAFPEAMNFWLQTQQKPDAVLPESGLIRISDYRVSC